MRLLTNIMQSIECAIDEWGTGTRIDIHFTSEAYQDVFEEHLRVLTSLQIIARRTAALTSCENFWNGCMIMDGEHTGVSSQHLLIFIVASMLVLTPFRKK